MTAAAMVVDTVSNVRTARVYLLSELDAVIAANPDAIESIRTLGRLRSVNFATNQAVIEHQGAFLMLDIRTLYEFVAHDDALYEFVGELDCATRTLRCRIWRSLGGCDVQLFIEALGVHRRSLAALSAFIEQSNALLP